MKNFIFVMALLCLYSFTQAQTVGKPAGNTINFFDSSTSANGGGGQLGHLQTGTFSNLTGSSEWISIGESNNGPFYGMRVQKGADFATFSVNTNGSAENLDILWGGASNNNLNFKYAATATTPATTVMTLQSNGVATFNQPGNTTGRVAITSPGGTPGVVFYSNQPQGYRADIRRDVNGLWFGVNSSVNSPPVRMAIHNNGNVGIGTTNPTERLHVNGNIKTNVSFINSDRRYKDKIENLEKPMDLLNTINGVSYEYKKSEFIEQNFKEGKSLGFVAQDFEKSLPELLAKDEEGYYAVNYDGVIPILVEAVKELNVSLEEKNYKAAADETKIQNLELENETIKKEVSELKELVKELIASQDQNQAAKAVDNNILQSLNKSKLFQNTPNPSNGNTEISYLVEGKVGNITIDVYDAEGKMIQRFDNLPMGKNSVSLTEDLQPGIYFYTLFTDGQEASTKRMVVMQ